MNKTVKRVWNICSWVLISLILAVVLLTAGVRIIGLQPFSVLSGSMEPNYHVGALVYVNSVNPDEVKVGDAITFKLSGESLATHRVTAIDKSAKTFTTKGDANASADKNPVAFSDVVGKVSFTVPLLGYLTQYLTTLYGKIVVGCAIVVLLIVIYMPELLDKADKTGKVKSKASPQKEN